MAHYQIERGGKQFEAQLVIQPAARPASIENYLSVVGVLYLFIGLFIFARRWNATRAVHFYIFCLVSFVLYSFQYTGKLTPFDWEIYWAAIVARLLQPALLLHFALVFPERRPVSKGHGAILGAIYGVPGILLLVRVLVGLRELGFMPSIEARNTLDRLDLACLGIYFLLAAACFCDQLSPRIVRNPAAAVEVGDRRSAGRHCSVSAALHRAVFPGSRAAAVDEFLHDFAGAHPAEFRLRHHSLPPDGRGHHLQARAGLHGGERRRGGRLHRDCGADRSAVPHRVAFRDDGRSDRHRGGGVFVPAVPRLDSGAPGPLFLPGPPGLSPHAD